MSFKPLDLQVNISQINHVARTQQNEQSHPVQQQHDQAAHLLKDATRAQETVIQSGPSSEDGSVRDALADEGGRQEESGKRGKRDRAPQSGKKAAATRYVEEDKGGIVDFRR